VVWDWENNQAIASVKTGEDETPVTQCSFSLGKNPLIAVTGENILKVYKLESNKLTEEIIPDPQIGNIDCHLRLNDQVLLCRGSSGGIISVLAESAITERKDFEHRDSLYVAMRWLFDCFRRSQTDPTQFVATRCVKLFGDELPISVHTLGRERNCFT
jgi:hypothetical protein